MSMRCGREGRKEMLAACEYEEERVRRRKTGQLGHFGEKWTREAKAEGKQEDLELTTVLRPSGQGMRGILESPATLHGDLRRWDLEVH
jgi:hypothetical protein